MLNRQITWKEKFGSVLTAQGITTFPNILLKEGTRKKLGMTQGELLYIVTLFSFCWNKLELFPAHATIAGCLGLSSDAVRNYHRRLVRKGLIKSTPRRGGTNLISLQPLIKKLESLCSDNKEVTVEGVIDITGGDEAHHGDPIMNITSPHDGHHPNIDNNEDKRNNKSNVCTKHTTSHSDSSKNTSSRKSLSGNSKNDSSAYVKYAEEFLDQFVLSYERQIGKFPFRDTSTQIQLILKAFQRYDVPPAEYKGFVEDFFQSEDSYIRKSDYGIRVFLSQIPRLYANSRKKTCTEAEEYGDIIETLGV